MTQVNSPFGKVRALQRALYVAAKRNGRWKFPALYDRIALPDVLWRAWEQVRRNKGAAGIDGETIRGVEAYGVERMLAEMRALLERGRYRPQAARRVYIPKPGRPTEKQPLSIPRVRDRVLQTAARLVLEPIFEASFLPCSFGFRPRRSAQVSTAPYERTAERHGYRNGSYRRDLVTRYGPIEELRVPRVQLTDGSAPPAIRPSTAGNGAHPSWSARSGRCSCSGFRRASCAACAVSSGAPVSSATVSRVTQALDYDVDAFLSRELEDDISRRSCANSGSRAR